jgi:hypothetical protein
MSVICYFVIVTSAQGRGGSGCRALRVGVVVGAGAVRQGAYNWVGAEMLNKISL